MFIYSYNRGASSKALREALFCKFIASKNSKFVGSKDKLVINWGASSLPKEVLKSTVLNHPEAVKKAVDKRLTFKTLEGVVDCIPSTEDKEEAKNFLRKGYSVVVRDIVNGHGGEGITIVDNLFNLPDAPLYTRYIPKTSEYRIHVFKGKVIFEQLKARKLDVPDEAVNWRVRNLAGGFIFSHIDIQVDERAKELAIKAVQGLGLDFGSVDILYNKRRDKFYLLEVNTASGLTGATLQKYAEVFKAYEGTFNKGE